MRQFLKEKNNIIWFASAMLVIGGIMICRAFYGMDITDETFYLSTARRFYDGDMLFRDDWNSGQLFGLLMLPFYRAYVFFYGNNEGIILYVRILFVILEVFTSCFLFRVLLRCGQSFGAAFTASCCILVYARGNIITVSYYSLGFLTFLLSILWWIEAEEANNRKVYLILSGISFAVSVICMPYMILLFAVFTGTALFCRIRGDVEKSRNICWWLLGILLSAALFFVYFQRWIPWKDLFVHVSMVFQDPGLENVGLLVQLRDLLSYIVFVFLKYMWFVYALTFITVFLAGRGYVKEKRILKGIPWILLLEFLIQSVYVRSYFEGGIITTFLLFVLQLQILCPKCRIKRLEICFVLPGLLFGIAWIMGSNVGERVINMSFLLVNLWAVCFLWKFCQVYMGQSICLMRIPAYLLFAVLLFIRIFDVYRDGSIWKLDYQISSGSMKGIYTEYHRGTAYEQALHMIRSETVSGDTVAVLGCNPWVYLDTMGSCGLYSTWDISEGEELLALYYEMNPKKIPNVILTVPKEISLYESWKFSSHGAGIHEEEPPVLTGFLKALVEKEEYACIEYNGIVMYKKQSK